MKNIQTNAMEEFIRISLPNVNRDMYNLKSVKLIPYEWKHPDLFEKRLVVVIEECVDPEWIDKHLRHSHGFVEQEYEDRPVRHNALTLIERRKKRINKITKQTCISWVRWIKVFEWTKRAEDELVFLK